jgi:hypothetical protein
MVVGTKSPKYSPGRRSYLDLPLPSSSSLDLPSPIMSLRRLANLTRPFRLLAIESSADDSCAAIVSSDRKIWSNVVVKQHLIHG